MTVAVPSANRAPHPSGLADVLEVVLDKGIVIDAYVRLSLVGIEILTLDARVVIASVDTYLRFAEAVNRLDIQPQKQPEGLPGLIGDLQEGGAKHKTAGALSGVTDSAKQVAGSLRGGGHDENSGDEDDSRGDDEDSRGNGRSRTSQHRPHRPAPARRPASAGRRSSHRDDEA